MTRATLRTLQTAFMSVDLDNFYGESPTTANQNEQLNWAYARIARRCKLVDPKITFTPTADLAKYSLFGSHYGGVKLTKVYHVMINGTMLYARNGERGLWSYNELIKDYPTWQIASSGTPTKAVQLGQFLLLHAPPNAAVVSAAQNFICAEYIPAEMDDDADTPDLPEDLHPAIAYLAAVYAATPVASEASMWTRVQAFSAAWVDMVDGIAEMNMNSLADPGTTAGSSIPDFICL